MRNHLKGIRKEIIYYHGARNRRIILPALPDLTPEQEEDAQYCFTKQDFMLFNRPGTGKTLTLLRARELVQNEYGKKRTLIVVPKIAVRNWVRWTGSMFVDELITVVTGDHAAIWGDIAIVTYGLVSRNKLIADMLRVWEPEICIYDESHALSGFQSARTRELYGRKCDLADSIAQYSDYIWVATGTPIKRYYDDLWPTLRALRPDVLKKHHVVGRMQFMKKFCETQKVKINRTSTVTQACGWKNADLLNDILYREPIAVRRKANESLPSLLFREVDIDCEMSHEYHSEMEAAAKYSWDHVMEARELNPHLNMAMRQLGISKAQSCAEYIVDTVKREEVTPILVLFWHTDVARIIRQHLLSHNISATIIDGGTTTNADEEAQARFNNGELDVIIGQIQKMGVAINLQERCTRVMFVERSWSASDNEQGYGRVHRWGQKNAVIVENLMVPFNEAEDIKSDVIDSKRGAQRALDGSI